MRFIATVLLILAIGAAGCSRSVTPRSAPVTVAGKVTHAGQPVGDIVVTFQPLDVGHVGAFTPKPDGTFLGELIAGNYAYYVGKSPAPNSEAVLKKIDPKYYEADMGRSVTVEPGKEIFLALD